MNRNLLMEDIRQLMESHRIASISTDEGVLFQMTGDTLEIKQNVSIKEKEGLKVVRGGRE